MPGTLNIQTRYGTILVDIHHTEPVMDHRYSNKIKGITVFNREWPGRPNIRLFANRERLHAITDIIAKTKDGDEIRLANSEWGGYIQKDAEFGEMQDFYDLISYPELAGLNEKKSGGNLWRSNMSDNSEVWIITERWTDNNHVVVKRVTGTELQVRKYLNVLIQEERKYIKHQWVCGTDLLCDLETEKDDNGVLSIHGHAYYEGNPWYDGNTWYNGNRIDYHAVPEKTIYVKKLKD